MTVSIGDHGAATQTVAPELNWNTGACLFTRGLAWFWNAGMQLCLLPSRCAGQIKENTYMSAWFLFFSYHTLTEALPNVTTFLEYQHFLTFSNYNCCLHKDKTGLKECITIYVQPLLGIAGTSIVWIET